MTHLQQTGGVFKKQGSGGDLGKPRGWTPPLLHKTTTDELVGNNLRLRVGRDSQGLASLPRCVPWNSFFLTVPFLIFERKTLK